MSKEAKLLFISVYLLVGLGIVMTYSSSAVFSAQVYKNAQHLLTRQILYVMIGTIVMFIVSAIPVSFWKHNARAMLLLAVVFLMLVYVPVVGHSAGGANRWIDLGILNFQPAEFAKVAVCLYLADYLSRKKKIINKGDIKVFLPPLILIGLVCALTLLQPDLGSTAFIFITVSILFFCAGIRMKYVAIAAAFFAPFFYFLIMRVPYRLSRVTAYLNPWEDPQGSGFQIIQSFLAFGLGGVHGVGLGQGMQKLFYLPSSHNDFIFSIIGEELGLIGALAVMLIYAVVLMSGIMMAKKTNQEYERLVILSLTFMIVLQALIHMMVATGLIPTKGLPLPFVSFGGTSMVFNLMAVGMLLGVDRRLRSSR